MLLGPAKGSWWTISLFDLSTYLYAWDHWCHVSVDLFECDVTQHFFLSFLLRAKPMDCALLTSRSVRRRFEWWHGHKSCTFRWVSVAVLIRFSSNTALEAIMLERTIDSAGPESRLSLCMMDNTYWKRLSVVTWALNTVQTWSISGTRSSPT